MARHRRWVAAAGFVAVLGSCAGSSDVAVTPGPLADFDPSVLAPIDQLACIPIDPDVTVVATSLTFGHPADRAPSVSAAPLRIEGVDIASSGLEVVSARVATLDTSSDSYQGFPVWWDVWQSPGDEAAWNASYPSEVLPADVPVAETSQHAVVIEVRLGAGEHSSPPELRVNRVDYSVDGDAYAVRPHTHYFFGVVEDAEADYDDCSPTYQAAIDAGFGALFPEPWDPRLQAAR